MSLPKKWLSQSGATDDFGFPEVTYFKHFLTIVTIVEIICK